MKTMNSLLANLLFFWLLTPAFLMYSPHLQQSINFVGEP